MHDLGSLVFAQPNTTHVCISSPPTFYTWSFSLPNISFPKKAAKTGRLLVTGRLWFSPFGAKNQARRLARITKTRPMKTDQLQYPSRRLAKIQVTRFRAMANETMKGPSP